MAEMVTSSNPERAIMRLIDEVERKEEKLLPRYDSRVEAGGLNMISDHEHDDVVRGRGPIGLPCIHLAPGRSKAWRSYS